MSLSSVSSILYIAGALYIYEKAQIALNDPNVKKLRDGLQKAKEFGDQLSKAKVPELPKSASQLLNILDAPGGSQELAKIAGQPGGTAKLMDLGVRAALPPGV